MMWMRAGEKAQQLEKDGMDGLLEGVPQKMEYRTGVVREFKMDSLIEMIICRPQLSVTQLAQEFGMSVGGMHLMMNTDAFRLKLKEKRAEVVAPLLTASVEERLKGVTSRSLEVLAEKLDRPTNAIDDDLVLKAAALGLRNGEGGGKEAKVHMTVDLSELAKNMLNLQTRIQGGSGPSVERENVGEGHLVGEGQAN